MKEPPKAAEVPLSVYLSKREWQATYALNFALEASGEAGSSQSFGEGMRRAIHRLTEAGYQFIGLTVHDDGRIEPNGGPVCPQNELYLHALALGHPPDFRVACAKLLELIEQEVLTDYELYDLARWAKRTVDQQALDAPEMDDEQKEMTAEALAAVGIPVIAEGREN